MVKSIRSIYHYFLALSGAFFYGFPSRETYVIGVTGTKGKSSTIELLSWILESAGHKTAFISSVKRKIGGNEEKNLSNNSMPGRFTIQHFLRRAVKEKCGYVIIEVTSEGVLQHRDRFIEWNAGVFLNISPEHIERHGSFEKYRAAKADFFKHVSESSKKDKIFAINGDDENRVYFENAAKSSTDNRIVMFSSDDLLKGVRDGMRDYFGGINLSDSRAREGISEWLVPEFNLANAVAAVTLVKELGITATEIFEALKKFKGVPGRMEYVLREPFKVVVDYAHTPDSLEKVYKSLKKELDATGGKLICVLGACGGGRDKWKRLVMGGIAEKYCDRVYLTNEDPYDEDPESILSEIEKGVGDISFLKDHVKKILDRREAIKAAIVEAKKGDTVIITGKGSEAWMHLEKGRRIEWSDREVVRSVMN